MKKKHKYLIMEVSKSTQQVIDIFTTEEEAHDALLIYKDKEGHNPLYIKQVSISNTKLEG